MARGLGLPFHTARRQDVKTANKKTTTKVIASKAKTKLAPVKKVAPAKPAQVKKSAPSKPAPVKKSVTGDSVQVRGVGAARARTAKIY